MDHGNLSLDGTTWMTNTAALPTYKIMFWSSRAMQNGHENDISLELV